MAGKSTPWLVGAVLLACAVRADEIVRLDGGRIENIAIESATSDRVVYRRKDPRITASQEVRAPEVAQVLFLDDPAMSAAAGAMNGGNWDGAIEAYGRARLDPRLAEAAVFGAALARVRRAEATGQGEAEAQSALDAYLKEYRDTKGFHVPMALYEYGVLLVGTGAADKAAEPFAALAAFDGESRRIRAEIGKGLVALARNDARSASTIFRTVHGQAERAKFGALSRETAALRGRALVAEGRQGEAVDFLAKHVRDSSAGNLAVFDRYLAQAYNGLGDAYAARNGPDDKWRALYQYLWTTVLFPHVRNECAEGFSKAAALARELGAAADADRLLAALSTQYGDTRWAAKLK